MLIKKINAVLLSCAAAVGILQTTVCADNPVVQTRYTADPAPMVSADGETHAVPFHFSRRARGR